MEELHVLNVAEITLAQTHQDFFSNVLTDDKTNINRVQTFVKTSMEINQKNLLSTVKIPLVSSLRQFFCDNFVKKE